MKFYRLSENHPKYGIAGHVIPHPAYIEIPYDDRALYDKVSESGKGFAYKLEVSKNNSTPALYYMDSFADVASLVIVACEAQGNQPAHMHGLTPKKTFDIQIELYLIKIIYRKEEEL